MADGNPFAAPSGSSFHSQQQMDPYNTGNPFAAPPTPQQQQMGYPPQQQQLQMGYAPQQQQPQQQTMQHHGQLGMMPPQQPQQQSYDPFSQAPPQQQLLQAPDGQYSSALVTTQQPANPYAGMVAQPNNQYASAPASSFDPFAAPPAPSQAMVPVSPNEVSPYPGAPPLYQQQYQQQPVYGQQQQQQPPVQQQPPPTQPPAPAPPPQQQEPPSPRAAPPVSEVGIVPAPSSGYPGAPRSPVRAPQEPDEKEVQTPTGLQARNKYSTSLAQNAPLGASPLPRADMVRKTGYVLSRISFRTIVMKKWKQSFWVQYGPHTMLWFRSQADFDDWLNNPYHTQAQRNFLIKLAVNFAHDLYKPNVRGYQVTQCRTKSYGTKLIRQFKLERWMDYGPTIAAAFGSNNPKEVDDLREALVACMRNTPLNGGIRATGAVRERADQGYDSHGAEGGERRTDDGYHADAASYGGHQNSERPISRSVASASDLRNDQNAFDDTASLGDMPAGNVVPDLLDFSEPPQQHPPQHQTSLNSQPVPPYAMQSPPMQPNPYPGMSPQQQYGAPPPQQYQGGQYPVQQQQQYAPQPQHMQQQQYPGQGQPQPYGGY